MRKTNLLLFTLLTFFLFGCDRDTAKRKNTDDNRTLTADEIRKQKPTVPDLTPEPYYLGSDEPTFIRVVTNSTRPQKVWMVYYDTDAKDWVKDLSLAEGSGENNHAIRDVPFQKLHAISSRSQDFPEFYMGYSVDEGRNWINHKIGRTSLRCIEVKARQLKQKEAHLLVSLPLNPENNLPEVAIVLQWNKWRRAPGKNDLAGVDLKKMCSALKELPLDWSGAAQQ